MSDTSNICKQPVVAIVGHIDHGKTTLLDYIRKSSVAAKETGGITQRVSAYEVTHTGAEGVRNITFIDTPGHEAFQKMRARAGASADIAILIVAADDGVKPQTLEAHKAILAAGIPFIVAFTKIDKDTATLERAKESVMKNGIYLEGLGGEIPFVGVSGKTGAGVPELLDLIGLVSDLHNITCDKTKDVEAVVLESARDPKAGISATVIIRAGTVTLGGFAVAGSAMAPLRTLEDFTGAKVKEISCGKPARITGFDSEPRVGTTLILVKTKKEAERFVDEAKRPTQAKPREGATGDAPEKRTLIRLALKADTAGSLEALEHELAKVSEEGIELHVVSANVGPISDNDIRPFIGFSPAIVLGFNVKADTSAKDLAERQHITLETRSIIYELGDWLKEEIKQYKPEVEGDAISGTAHIIKHFSSAGAKHVVGGKVLTGVVHLKDQVMIIRRGIEVGAGKITNLQMQRADVDSVPEGMEFGAQVESKADIVSGDTISAMHKKS
ncbi:MAG: translation initiation factor IF-2 [Patescibacteria group bacterium]